MSKKIKVGIIGGGGILGNHAPGFNRLQDVCEVVVAEKDPRRHERIRELLGQDVEIHEDYTKILEDEDIVAVDLLLPHDLHMPMTIAAAKAGKHVMTEKVMARNVYECEQMIAACEEAGVSLTVCHDRRYDADWQALKTIVDSGDLGEILFWKMEHNQNVIWRDDMVWARTRDGIGGGAIMSCLTHQIDSLRWYDGEVDSVTCMTKTVPERMEGESIGAVTAKMKSGALALLSINWNTPSRHSKNGLWYEFNHVTGTKGEAYYISDKGTYVNIHNGQFKVSGYNTRIANDFVKVDVSTELTGHQRCIDEWIKSLRGEKANIATSGRDSLKTVEVAEAAYISEQTNRVVELPIVPTPWKNTSK